jgi:hypothetical protein
MVLAFLGAVVRKGNRQKRIFEKSVFSSFLHNSVGNIVCVCVCVIRFIHAFSIAIVQSMTSSSHAIPDSRVNDNIHLLDSSFSFDSFSGLDV